MTRAEARPSSAAFAPSRRSLRASSTGRGSAVEADVAVDALTASGALGARLTGGGFGGSVIALCEESLIDTNVGAVRAAYAKAGFAPPSHRIVTPSDGARRDA